MRTKLFMKISLVWIIAMSLLISFVFIAGCESSVDPVSGDTLTSIDPNIIGNLQEMGDAASLVLGILSMFWPVLLPIAGYIGGAVRISRKLTPKLTEAQVESKMYHTIASSTVLGIEEFKKEFPNEWSKLMSRLDEIKTKVISVDNRLKIENVIRGLRGLPPQE